MEQDLHPPDKDITVISPLSIHFHNLTAYVMLIEAYTALQFMPLLHYCC